VLQCFDISHLLDIGIKRQAMYVQCNIRRIRANIVAVEKQ